jgi:YggT family protein
LTVVALSRGDIADFVGALVLVYTVLIFVNVMLSWIGQFRPIPYNLTLRAVTGFVEESTNPYLNLFRAWMPRLGPFDISPVVAIIVLSLVGTLAVNLIRG